MAKDKFGHGQTTCKVCGVQMTDVKPVVLKIKHKSGTDLVEVKYYPPLCAQHRGDGTLDIEFGWEASTVPVDVMNDGTT